MQPGAQHDRPRYIGGIAEEESSIEQRSLFVRQTFVLQTESYICGGGCVHKTNGGGSHRTGVRVPLAFRMARTLCPRYNAIFIIIQIDKASVF